MSTDPSLAKSTAIVGIANWVYDTVSTKVNVSLPIFNSLLTNYSIDPLNIAASLNALPVDKLGALTQAIGELLSEVGKDVSATGLGRQCEALGYTSLAALLADIPNIFGASAATVITRNLNGISDVQQHTAAIVSPAILEPLIAALAGLANALTSLKAEMDRVV